MSARTGLCSRFHCSQFVPLCRGMALTGHGSCGNALAGKTFELRGLT